MNRGIELGEKGDAGEGLIIREPISKEKGWLTWPTQGILGF